MSDARPQVPVSTYTDAEGRDFHYVLRRHEGTTDLVVHFTAFFGDWGDRKHYRAIFQGYFHRLFMLGDISRHNWLFVCDEYGAERNGTYYTGESGDFFVERATAAIIDETIAELGVSADHVVTVGSSSGATGAVKFALRLGAAGAVAISPHLDLDTSAELQGRHEHVAYICPDHDPYAPHNQRYTRQIRALMEQATTLPALFVQSCRDDAGVHDEQVVPIVARWRELGGAVYLDERPVGGHTSDFATREVLADVVDRLLAGRPADVARYQKQRRFRPARAPWYERARDWLWTVRHPSQAGGR